jgi:hypothetical protein
VFLILHLIYVGSCDLLKERDPPVDIDVNGKIILEWIFKATGWEAVDWLHLAENRDQ